jgi:hypothetical protein
MIEQNRNVMAQALRFVWLRSVVDWPLGKLTYGNN